jgi:hypothetical protein
LAFDESFLFQSGFEPFGIVIQGRMSDYLVLTYADHLS